MLAIRNQKKKVKGVSFSYSWAGLFFQFYRLGLNFGSKILPSTVRKWLQHCHRFQEGSRWVKYKQRSKYCKLLGHGGKGLAI